MIHKCYARISNIFRNLPQKSSVIVVGEARIFDKWSSWKYSFKGMISSNSTREIPEKKSNIRALFTIGTLTLNDDSDNIIH